MDENKKGATGHLFGAIDFHRSRLVDFDLDLFLLCFFGFWKDNLQHPIFVRGINLVALDPFGKSNRAGEGSITPLDKMIIFFFLFSFLFFLTFDGEQTVGQRDVDVLRI